MLTISWVGEKMRQRWRHPSGSGAGWESGTFEELGKPAGGPDIHKTRGTRGTWEGR